MRILSSELSQHISKQVLLQGWLHKKRSMGGLMFIVLRDRGGLVQVVVSDAQEQEKLQGPQVGSILTIKGKAVEEPRAKGGVEIHEPTITVELAVSNPPLIEIDKPIDHKPDNLDTLFEYRTISLRNVQETGIFRIQSVVGKTIREYFDANGFTEIHTPKLLAAATEGGAEVFKLDYFGTEATLAQSPQFYKQMMVGVLERVYEIAPVYRAELSATTRHMSEYISVDGEMGFITLSDLQDFLSGLLNHVVDRVWDECGDILDDWKSPKPQLTKQLPQLSIEEIHKLYTEYSPEAKDKGISTIGEKDLRPDEERWICDYAAKELGSEAIFVTDWPASEMKFYHKAQENNPEFADRIDVLFRGVEIVTGSMRENKYEVVLKQLKEKAGGDPENPGFKYFLMAMAAGMPPHGGFGLGLERLTQKIVGLNNIKEATLFPRDINRLTP